MKMITEVSVLLVVILIYISNLSYGQGASSFDSTSSLLKIPELIVDENRTFEAELKYSGGLLFELNNAVETPSKNIATSEINGTYEAVVQPGKIFSTDRGETVISFSDSYVEITIGRFFDKDCKLDGTIANTRESASGTYQCADFTSGTWESSQIKRTDGVLTAKFSFEPSDGMSFSLLVVGVQIRGPFASS